MPTIPERILVGDFLFDLAEELTVLWRPGGEAKV
jgi:hypothetical protein